jgi:DUF1365 family protein
MIFLIVGFILFIGIIYIGLKTTKINGALQYSGYVTHTRLKPKINSFKYNITFDYFNIDNPPKGLFISHDTKYHMYKSKKDIENKLNKKLTNVFLLTYLKSFSYCFNSISLYLCYDQNILVNIIAEVSNTPWNEQTDYILDIKQNSIINNNYEKKMHVSPFNPSYGQTYKFTHKIDNEIINFGVGVYENNDLILSANINLKKQNFNPFLQFRPHLSVIYIYIRAFQLYLKGFKYFEKK